MTELVILNQNNQITTSSLTIAQTFGKLHKDVLRKIETLDVPQDFNRRNFTPVEYRDEKGELRKSYEITRDGFTLLAMGFTGKKAMQFKIAYIEAFNKMEQALKEKAHMPIEPIPAQIDMKAIGGMVKRCCATAIKETLLTENPNLANAVGYLIDYIAEERAKKKLDEWKAETSQRVYIALNGDALCQR